MSRSFSLFFLSLRSSAQRSFIPTLGLLPLSLCVFVLFPLTVDAATIPGGNIANTTIRLVDLAKPAVVRMITTTGARLTVHFSSTQSATFPLDGTAYKLESTGSGTFISAHGDILTSEHVVHPPADDLDDSLYQYAASDVARYINQTFFPNPPYASDDAYAVLKGHTFRSESHYMNPASEAFLSTDYLGAIPHKDLQSMPPGTHAAIAQIKAESPIEKQDMAIAHVNMENTPSVPLGDSSTVAQQDELTIIGFPSNGDVTSTQRPEQLLTSSVNRVFVSSLKKTDGGSPVIQVAGNVEHGDSGGPALNAQGQLVGIVSFYASNNSIPVGTSFLQASESARTLVAAQKLDTQPGPLQLAWSKALTEYSTSSVGHWQQAAKDFALITKQYPSFLAASTYLSYAQDQAQHEAPPTQPTFDLTGRLVIILLVLSLGGLVLGGIMFGRVFMSRLPAKGSLPSSVSPPSTPSPFLSPSADDQSPAITRWQQYEPSMTPFYPTEGRKETPD